MVGYAGCNGWGSDAELFIARSNETAQALLDCGGFAAFGAAKHRK